MCAGVFAGVTLAAHVKYSRDQWSTWSNHLRALMLVGCLGQLAGVCGFAVYLALAVSEHQGSFSEQISTRSYSHSPQIRWFSSDIARYINLLSIMLARSSACLNFYICNYVRLRLTTNLNEHDDDDDSPVFLADTVTLCLLYTSPSPRD